MFHCDCRGSIQCFAFPLPWWYWGHLHYCRAGVGRISEICVRWEFPAHAEVRTVELAVYSHFSSAFSLSISLHTALSFFIFSLEIFLTGGEMRLGNYGVFLCICLLNGDWVFPLGSHIVPSISGSPGLSACVMGDNRGLYQAWGSAERSDVGIMALSDKLGVRWQTL